MCYFSSFGRHVTCVEQTSIDPRKIQLESLIETHFSDWLGKGFEIPAYEENRNFEVKSVVGFYRDSLLIIAV